MRNDLENSPGIEAIVSAVDHFIADRGLSDQAIVGHLDTNALWNELKVFESSQWLVVIIRFYPTPFNHSLIFRLPDWCRNRSSAIGTSQRLLWWKGRLSAKASHCRCPLGGCRHIAIGYADFKASIPSRWDEGFA